MTMMMMMMRRSSAQSIAKDVSGREAADADDDDRDGESDDIL